MKTTSLIALSLLGLGATACSTATVTLKGGRTIEGRIVKSDARRVVVRRAGPSAWVSGNPRGGTVRVARRQIEDVDHPGNVAAAAGVLLTTVGLIVASFAIDTGYDYDLGGVLLNTAVIGGGVGLLVFGGMVYVQSTSAYAGPPDDPWSDTNVSTRQVGMRWQF